MVEYEFLTDFDLLSDTQEDVRLCPWARPASQSLMDQHFKMECAHEEILHLNVEIWRFASYIHDEERFLLEQEESLLELYPHLSRQLRTWRLRLVLSNDQHVR